MPDNASQRNLIEAYAGLEGRNLIEAVIDNHEGRTALVSSFGAESSVLLHMVAQVDRSLPIIFLDTEKLFPETLAYRDALLTRLGLTGIRNIKPDVAALALHDPDGFLHRTSPDQCCHIRKTLPLAEALQGFDAVLSGRKRFHGALRSDLAFVSLESGRLKVEPLAAFSPLDLQNYMALHDLPPHPLLVQGYRSIGCAPCTTPGGTDDNPRAGRWAGTDKTECGIHFTSNGKIIPAVSRDPVGV